LAYHPIGFKKEVELNIWKNEDMTLTQISKSLFYFVLAGLCEIGGGYLVWLWLREGKNALFALAGSVILIIYGIIPTLQPAHFGRVYAAYGGVFIILSILWGWQIDKIAPDRFDIIGGLIALMGVGVIMFWPRA
jgi:small multidrug resistance family-3 protein